MKRVFAVCFLLMSVAGHAEIRVAESLKPIEEEIKNFDADTLVIFDVGDTLLGGRDAIWHVGNRAWERAWFQKNYPDITQEKRVAIAHLVRSDVNLWKALDPKWPSLIDEAYQSGARVVALTKMYADPSLKGLTYKVLIHFGIHFRDTVPELTKGTSFVYDKGIIEMDGALKGPVLKEVLSLLAKKPKKIVFVDDLNEQIQSVHQACQELGIPCVALHLTAFSAIPPIHEELVDKQLHVLVLEDRMISEEEARELLAK